MRPRIAILLGALLLAGACGEGKGDGGTAPPSGPGSAGAAPSPVDLPSLVMVRGPEGFRCEASAAPRTGDAALEIVIQSEDGGILARGPATEPLIFELAPTTRGRISTVVRYASGHEQRRETLLP